ncbi:unnamed protein product [Paramecium pentaurelia]|uniref:Uncharacterized protein n=1 Tax=Paramecium pentaurelia TaxID=43138 RepID=A0A8S1XX95_9CILI|nr:unnamed protein product [Paramecium pentaurelia]
MNSTIKLKVDLNKVDQKQSILEIVEKLQGEIYLEYDGHIQNALIQTQNLIIDPNNIFHLNNHNQLQQDQYFNEAIGISKKIKFIVIHNLMKNHFYQKAKLLQMKIFPDWNLSEYKTIQQLNPTQQHLLEQINQQINKIILFSAFSKNSIEKNSKINFLYKSLDKLAAILETNQGNLLLGEVQEPYEYARYLNKLIFIINLNENVSEFNQNLMILQKQILLNRFINDNFKIHTFIISITKPKCSRIELKEIAYELIKQNQNINIKVGYNRFDITSFEKLIYFEIEQYDDEQNIEQFLQQEIQDRASKILRLNIQDKINFENFICKLPFITNSNIKFKHQKIGIKLKNSFYQDNQFRYQVNQQLKQLKSQLLHLKIDKNFSVYLNLVEIEQKKQILTNLFMDVTQQKYILYINDVKQQYIELIVYFHQFIKNDLITLEKILNETMDQLQIASLQMNELNQLELTIEQFQQKYSALLYIENQKLNFILHSKYLNQIKNLLNSYKTLTLLSYKPKSKLYAQQILYDYKNKIIEQSQEILSIKLSSNNEILYFECPTKNMTVLDIFIKYEQVLDQLLLEIPLQISKLESKYLHNNCQKEIQKISQEQIFDLHFNFQEYQTTKNSQEIKGKNINTKNQFIKFLTKEVNFDTNLKCEISMRMILNNNFDIQISYQQEDKVHPNVLSIKEYFLFYQKIKIPYKQIGVVYEEIKDIFPKLLQLFMSKDQTKFQELKIFINNDKFKSQYEQELLMTLITSIQETYQDFQWQWSDGTKFNDYDDAMINQQIEIAYQAYRLDNKKNEMILKFPYSYQPGTHTIDLNKGTILDHASALIQQIKQKDGYYYIGKEQADDILNQYIQERIQMKKQQFTVFLKKYLIFFKTKDEIYQINLDSKYKRKIRREIQTDKYFKFIHDFIQQKCNQETPQQTPDADNQIYCYAKTFIKQNQDIQQAKFKKTEEITNKINIILQQYIATYEIKLPVTNDQIYFSFLDYLKNNTLQIEGDLNQNETIYIKSFEKNLKSIQEVVQFLHQIPQTWNTSSYQRLYYFDILQPDFEEVKQSFPFLNIKTVQLIQNYDLWAKYQSIKSKLEGWKEELLIFGNKQDCAQEEIGKVTLSLSFDIHKGPYIKCGNTIAYVNDNYFESQKGQKQIILVQVLLGQPQDLKQQFVISDYAENNYKEGEYYYIKRNKIYPKFLITLNEQ